MKTLRMTWQLMRELPERLADALDRWVMRQHLPPVERPADWRTDPSFPRCGSCRELWPCPEFRTAEERHLERRERGFVP